MRGLDDITDSMDMGLGRFRQLVIRLTVQETRVGSLGLEDPLEEEMATHPSILAWEIPWTEEPCGLQFMMEPFHCFMSGSNCCFLTCIQVSQETGKVVWYSHLLKNFPQFVVIHTVKALA